METSNRWLTKANLILFVFVVGTPFLLVTPLKVVALAAFLIGTSYVAGVFAIFVAVRIARAKDLSRWAKIGNLVLSTITILVCLFFSAFSYSCRHMSF